MTAQVELISVHVPKSAGTSFAHVLAQQYPDGLFMDYRHEPMHPHFLGRDMDLWREEQALRAVELPARIRVIHGHFWAGKYDAIFPEAKKVTWLREPVRRLVSHYYYFKSKPSLPNPHPLHRKLHEKNLSLAEFARLPAMQNIMTTRWLRDTPLKAFDFVGVQEHFAEDLADLAGRLDWKAVTIPGANRTVHEDYNISKIDADTLKELESLNADDIRLYREALALRGH